MILLTPLSILTSNSWIMIWTIMEINTFAFILTLMPKENLNNHESTMKYFVVQTMASLMFLLTWLILIFNKKHHLTPNLSFNVLSILLFMKMAAPPFHKWIIKMCISMKDNSLMIILSWQKLIPLIILCQLTINITLTVTILFSGMISTISQFNINSSILIILFSSMFHLSWMFLSTFISFKTMIIYLSVYSFILFPIIKFFKKTKTHSISFLSNTSVSSYVTILILSMAGTPPLLGFLPKWMIIKSSTFNPYTQSLLIVLLILSSINFFIYSRLISNSWMIPPMQMKSMKMFNYQKFFLIGNFSLPLIMMST